MKIELSQQSGQRYYSVTAHDGHAFICNTALGPDEALYAVAGVLMTGKSHFLAPPIKNIQQEIHYHGLMHVFGGDR